MITYYVRIVVGCEYYRFPPPLFCLVVFGSRDPPNHHGFFVPIQWVDYLRVCTFQKQHFFIIYFFKLNHQKNGRKTTWTLDQICFQETLSPNHHGCFVDSGGQPLGSSKSEKSPNLSKIKRIP